MNHLIVSSGRAMSREAAAFSVQALGELAWKKVLQALLLIVGVESCKEAGQGARSKEIRLLGLGT